VAGGFGAPDIGGGLKASLAFLTMIGTAMVPVLFAYGGWQPQLSWPAKSANQEEPAARARHRSDGRGRLYLAVNFVCVRALGISDSQTRRPRVRRHANGIGPTGARLIAAGIAISTLGFLSQSMLTAPRVYFAMARDGLFFWCGSETEPAQSCSVIAIVMQGLLATVIALSGNMSRFLTTLFP